MTTAEYRALTKDTFVWSDGHGKSNLDPFDALRASGAPAVVIAAFESARNAGYEIRFEAYSSHVGWGEHVSALAIADPAVREKFDEADRLIGRNLDLFNDMRDTRWVDSDDGIERWEWTTDDG